MRASREISLPVSLLSDLELRIAIAREVMGWRNLRRVAGDRITGNHPAVMTTVAPSVPDWITSESHIAHLESVIIHMVGATAYRGWLGEIAGEFNPHPTLRQRCEAALLAARNRRCHRLTD